MNLVLGFMVWVIISALLPFIREDISIAADRLAILTAIPVVLGSVLRIPLGYYANVVGARIVLSPALSSLFPVYFISSATSFTHLVIGGLFLGIGGRVLGRRDLTAQILCEREARTRKWDIRDGQHRHRHYHVFAPVIATQIGWSRTVQLYLVLFADLCRAKCNLRRP